MKSFSHKKIPLFLFVLIFLILPLSSSAATSMSAHSALIQAPEDSSDLFPMSALINGIYLWGYADYSGRFVIQPKYTYASEWYDSNGKLCFSAYGRGGAFFDGVAATWDRLVNKQGETVYERDLSQYGISSATCVGDSLVFGRNKGQGVIRADGTVILPAAYTFVRLTPCKQILTCKNGETYRLRNAAGKEIYRFPTYMTGDFFFDGSGCYMYRNTNNRLVVLSTTGKVTANIPIPKNAKPQFISGLIQIVEADGRCQYFDTAGKALHLKSY